MPIFDRFFVLVLCCYFTGCTAQNMNRTPLFLENEKRAIIIPAKFGDIDAPYIFFDTGVPSHFVQLDLAFFTEHLQPVWKISPNRVNSSYPTAWEPSNSQQKIKTAAFYAPVKINICGNDLDFNNFVVNDMSKMLVNYYNGCIGFPYDSTRIWEFNFEHNFLEIHEEENYKIPSDCYILPLLKGPTDCPYIQFPISVKYSDGDTTTIDELYLLDTGAVDDIILLSKTNENVIDFFRKKDDPILLSNRGNYRSRYIVEATLFEGLKIDSMRIYTDAFVDRMREAGIIGLNFMKRFNMFFDFKSRQIGFQPIRNFERIVNHDVSRFYFSWDIKEDHRRFIKELAPVNNNYYKEAGVKEGDEVIAINGIKLQNLSIEDRLLIEKSRIKEMDILRNEESLKITVRLGEEAFYE